MTSAQPAPHKVLHKGFLDVAGRRLHYTRMGQGPSVVLLHASPCSAQVMRPIQEEWCGEFTCFAFDLPGFGRSEPLEVAQLSTEDLADAIAGGMRALGIEKAALYGRHTGGGVAVELAHRHPDLAVMVLTDGFPVFTNAYSEERIAEYLPPITPQWDGGHLTWTWYRYREQHIFWPWDRPLLAHRADADLPDADFIHRGTVELLQAADTYAETYASAFRHAGLAMIDQVKPPVCYGNRPGDSQFKTVKHYPESAWIQIFDRDPERASIEEQAVLRQHLAPPAPGVLTTRPQEAAEQSYFLTPQGPVYLRRAGMSATGTPIIFLPDLPGSVDLHLDEISRLGEDRPVYALDPAGNAHSELAQGAAPNLDLWCAQLEAFVEALDVPEIDLYARGTAAALALSFVNRHPDRVGRLDLVSPPLFDAAEDAARAYAPDISPTEEGAHLLRLWHHLRDQMLWFPCFDKRPETIRRAPFDLSPNRLHAKAIVLLQQPRLYHVIWQELLRAPLAVILAKHRHKCTVHGAEDDVFAPHLPRALALLE